MEMLLYWGRAAAGTRAWELFSSSASPRARARRPGEAAATQASAPDRTQIKRSKPFLPVAPTAAPPPDAIGEWPEPPVHVIKHSWRGRYGRLFRLGHASLSTHDPTDDPAHAPDLDPNLDPYLI